MFLSKTRIFPIFPLIIVYPLNYYTRGEMIKKEHVSKKNGSFFKNRFIFIPKPWGRKIRYGIYNIFCINQN